MHLIRNHLIHSAAKFNDAQVRSASATYERQAVSDRCPRLEEPLVVMKVECAWELEGRSRSRCKDDRKLEPRVDLEEFPPVLKRVAAA